MNTEKNRKTESSDIWLEEYKKRKATLAKPFANRFDDNTVRVRVRRNLLVACSVSAIMLFGGDLNIDTSKFLGLQFNGLTNHKVYFGLVIVTAYLLIHFTWLALDDFSEWRLRLTGTQLPTPTEPGMSFGSNDDCNAGGTDQSQLTLYAWWVSNIADGRRRVAFREWQGEIQAVRDVLNDKPDDTQAVAKLDHLEKKLDILISHFARIDASLKRFDRAFYQKQDSQKWRWLILEFGLPVALGALAIIFLLVNIFL